MLITTVRFVHFTGLHDAGERVTQVDIVRNAAFLSLASDQSACATAPDTDFQNGAFGQFCTLLGQLPQFVAAVFVNQRVMLDVIVRIDEMLIDDNYILISNNLIYGIHCSYYSILISLSIENVFIIC